jgi:hypothetical protein
MADVRMWEKEIRTEKSTVLRWITLRKLDNYQKNKKKEMEMENKRTWRENKGTTDWTWSQFCCTIFFSFFPIRFRIGLRITLVESYSNSYKYELYIYKSGLNRLSIAQ